MHIIFLSTHNFATNPRLVKEIDLALNNSYAVTVVCCEFDNWSKSINDGIVDRLKPHINYYPVSATRKPLFSWLASTGVFMVGDKKLKRSPKDPFWLSVRSNKRSWLLLQKLEKIKDRFDLVVAHNPGSFYPALQFAKKHNIPFGIDLEDYHPGETTVPVEQERFRELNKIVLPLASYITAASPLILSWSKKDLEQPLKKEMLVLNYFPEAEFLPPAALKEDHLNLVWFSQNIAGGRGLEEIIPVIAAATDVRLHLYGNMDQHFFDSHLKHVPNIVIHDPLQQADLHKTLRLYDAALALERPASNLNRDLCITNKILAYQQAGIYILASHTSAQDDFMKGNTGIGMLTSLDEKALSEAIRLLARQKDELRGSATQRYRTAAGLTWENESIKLTCIWEEFSPEYSKTQLPEHAS